MACLCLIFLCKKAISHLCLNISFTRARRINPPQRSHFVYLYNLFALITSSLIKVMSYLIVNGLQLQVKECLHTTQWAFLRSIRRQNILTFFNVKISMLIRRRSFNFDIKISMFFFIWHRKKVKKVLKNQR